MSPSIDKAQELAIEAVECVSCAQSMLFSTIYRTETSRCWAVTKELSTLDHKLEVMFIKFQPEKALNKKIVSAKAALNSARTHALFAYSYIYHKTKLGYYQKEQAELRSCDLKLKEVKSILKSIQSL